MAIAKKRKRFFDVEIPLINQVTHLQGFNISELDNKFIKYDLTRTLRGKSIILRAKVQVKDEKATATPVEIKLLQYYLRRMVRKGTNYVEDSFSTDCKNAQVRVKPFLVTRRKVSRAVRRALREKAKEELVNYLKTRNTDDVFEDILRNQLQKTLSLKLKKIYPLSACEIRVFKIEKSLEAKKEAPKGVPSEEGKKEISKKKETTKAE